MFVRASLQSKTASVQSFPGIGTRHWTQHVSGLAMHASHVCGVVSLDGGMTIDPQDSHPDPPPSGPVIVVSILGKLMSTPQLPNILRNETGTLWLILYSPHKLSESTDNSLEHGADSAAFL